MKNKNLKLLLARIILVVILLIVVVWMFTKKKDKEGEAGEIKVEQQNSTYDSKLAAYKAKKKQKKEEANRQLYNPNMDMYVVDSIANVQENQQDKKHSVQPVYSFASKKERTQHEYSSINRLEEVTGRSKPHEEVTEGEESQEELAREFQQQQNERTEKENRRKSMQAWNTGIAQAENVNGYKAVIHGTQLVKSGKTATFRTREEIKVSGIKIPQNTLISGVVSVGENRVNVNISTIRIGTNIYPVNLVVYGSDGLLGIPAQMQHIRNAANREVTNEAASTIRRRGGIVGDVISTVAKGVNREKEQEVQLIDNQTIFLKSK